MIINPLKQFPKMILIYSLIFFAIVLLTLVLVLVSLALKKMVQLKTRELQKSNEIIKEKNRLLMQSEEQLIKKQKHIQYMAFHDPLTDLPNRSNIYDRLEAALKRDLSGAIILMDMDNFKGINDTMGHAFGDKVLKAIAERLMEIIQKDVFVSRFGGDEFLILLENEPSHERIKTFVEKVQRLFDKKLMIDENEITITCSMGVSVFPQDSQDINQLIMYVDLALYKAKSSRKGSHAFFENSLAENMLKKTMIESQLSVALDKDGFYLVYQPQVRLSDGEIECYEALLRMKNSNLSPYEFIAVAEENGAIIKIGRKVTSMVIRQLADWKQKGLNIKPVSINYSAVQFYDKDYTSFLIDELKLYGIDPELIEIEITESIFLNNTEQAIAFMNTLREMGVRISLDDFGTGYSSLSYLAFLPLDKIKLDKSISTRFLEMDSIRVVDSLISLMHSMGLRVTAEGIETFDQVFSLQRGGCDLIQGYYFSKPMRTETAEKHYNDNFIKHINFRTKILA